MTENQNGTLDIINNGIEVEQREVSFWEKIIKSPTGQGMIEDYLEHPLNFTGSHAMAKIIRGLSGILGNLDLAIVDIAMGLLQMFYKPKEV